LLLYCALPFLKEQIYLFIGFYLLANVSIGVGAASNFVMSANAVQFQEWKFGTRDEGLVIATISFCTKVGMALGNAFIAYMLAWAGYQPDAVSPAALHAIDVLYFACPMVLMACQILCMVFYDVERLQPQILRDLEARTAS